MSATVIPAVARRRRPNRACSRDSAGRAPGGRGHRRLLVGLAASIPLLAAGPDRTPAQEPYVERIPGTVVSFEMVPVPGGTVTIGSPDGPRTVEVGPFWIARTETTWDLYDVYVYELDRASPRDPAVDAVSRPTKPYVLPGDEFGHDGLPALGMSLNAARHFALWVSAVTGSTYRVPTEAQWERACRLGEAGVHIDVVAWTAADSDYRTHEVASKPADAIGLHDMRGNVAEWVDDQAVADSVVKGGSFESPPADAQCASRNPQTPAWNASDPQIPKSRWWLTDSPFVGLRLIRVPDDPAEARGTT